MKRTALRWIAAASTLAVLGTIDAARRPRYGGDLRIEMRAAMRTLDPIEAPPEAALLTQAVFETLVRLDNRGDPQPSLAISWMHDTARKCWVFTPRANVILHNGIVWTPAPIEAPDDQPIERILREMSRTRNAVVIRNADGSLTGTGPFKIAQWDAEKSAKLVAHDGYWGGRPYLDSIDVRMGRDLSDQNADLQLSKADVVEGQIARRPSGAPDEVIALEFDHRVPENVREAVALSIDRAAIHKVILQGQGEVSGALLPRWLTGYSFLFPVDRNVARARQIAGSATLGFSYDVKDPMIKAVAQRIEVNVREAGIVTRPAQGSPDVRLIRLLVASRDPWVALEEIASILNAPSVAAASPYEWERALLDGFRVVPIVHIAKAWALSPRVKNWPRLADIWLE
ncbi:MAG TPA: ABC transporter substrate-binding protein [Bryobacteraceae bacterium]|nr:ABC transporter substrate-binding protein [Bryobacteraceae bacterium]